MEQQDLDQDNQKKLGRRIILAREYKGFSLDALAAAAGMTADQLAAFEAGKAAISALQLLAISESLNLPIDHFFQTRFRTGGGRVSL